MTLQGLGWSVVGAAVVLGAFFAGIAVERSGNRPAEPVDSGKPEGRVQQVGQRPCDTRLPSGYTSDEGCPVAVGKGFQIGFHTVKDGWSVKAGKEGPVLTATVWNNNPGAIAEFWHTFHLHRYDGSLVEIVWCETPPFTAGQIRTITCEPLQPEGNAPYDEVTVHY